jgi:hypothetical protein
VAQNVTVSPTAFAGENIFEASHFFLVFRGKNRVKRTDPIDSPAEGIKIVIDGATQL